jgi:hypothetical protein
LTAAAVGLTAGSARADYTFAFSADGGATFNSTFAYDATQGPLTLSVYLQQSAPDTGLTSPGLQSGGVKLNYDGTILNSTAVTPNSAANGGPFQFGTSSTSGANTSTAAATVHAFNTPGTGVTADSNGRVLLGSFTFSGLALGSTAVLTADPTATNDNVLANGTALDSLIHYNAASVTVTAVPEPGTLLLTTLLATGVAGARLRRLRRNAAA